MHRILQVFSPALCVMTLAMPAAAEQYYVAPNGNDDNAGTAPNAPLNTFDQAIGKLRAGDTLILNDGTYTLGNSGRFFAEGQDNARSGTADNPITVKAANERKAWVKGNGQFAFRLQDVNHWTVDGVRVSSADYNEDEPGNGRVRRGSPFFANNVEHLKVRRLLAHNNNRFENSGGISINNSQHVLVEESELYSYHRNGFSAFRSEDVTFRRNYANSRQYSDLDHPDGYNSHGISPNGGDGTYVAYYSNDVKVINSISENQNEGFSSISGRNTAAGNSSGNDFTVLGSISINDYKPGGLQSRKKPTEYGGTGEYQPLKNATFKNVLVIGTKSKGFTLRAVKNATLENITFLNTNGNQAVNLNTNHQELGDPPRTIYPSNEQIDGSQYRLRNWLVVNQDGRMITNLEDNGPAMDFLLEHANIDPDTPLGEIRDPQRRRIMREIATGIGLGEGESAVFIPDDSNMSGAGKNGADIGANILYRYRDGELTDELLWNPETGAFPHGAVIEGINDVPGKSAFDVHQRLNVTPQSLPEPGSIGMLGLGGALLLGRRRSRGT